MTISKLFASLEGSWNFVRTIDNEGTMAGVAVFKRLSPTQLHYREEGKFQRERGGVFDVFRNYVYVYEQEAISVYFDERPLRLYHTLQFQRASMAKATHWCAPDRYDTEYRFLSLGKFSTSVTIVEPHRQVHMHTVFTHE